MNDDLTDLVVRILNEADIASRPGQYQRLNQISKDVEQMVRGRASHAWTECAKEAHDLGWLHDWALSDLLARNPYAPREQA